VSFDDDWKVNDVAFLKDWEHKLTLDKKDEKLLKDSYNNKWF
jgi:hypothetical protein